jgi:predicted acyltransferase
MSASPKPAPQSTRLLSLDAYRGAIMLLMVSAGLGIPTVAKSFTHSPIWQELAHQTDHEVWAGCSLWDLIQPSFMFMVGVAMPFSHASRLAKGQSRPVIAAHVVWRAVFLCLLGIFLTSSGKHTEWQFMNVLTQIGLGYAFVYLLIGRGASVQLTAAVGFLLIHWLMFYRFQPVDPFVYSALKPPLNGVTPYLGLFAHWNPVNNAGADIDVLFLNLFPREKPFFYNSQGYVTVNFISSMATMIFGLVAGEFLRRTDLAATRKLAWLTIVAGFCLALGYVMSHTVCPSVKKIWTPSWAVFSTGWTFAFLAAFYGVIDVAGFKGWEWPFRVVGMNSIAVYCMSMLMKPWVRDTIQRHFGSEIFMGTYFGKTLFDPVFAPIAAAATFTFVVWLVAAWMYKRKVFIRI